MLLSPAAPAAANMFSKDGSLPLENGENPNDSGGGAPSSSLGSASDNRSDGVDSFRDLSDSVEVLAKTAGEGDRERGNSR